MQQELKIEDMEVTVDAAGTLELARVNASVVKAVVKAVSDVIVAAMPKTTIPVA